MRTKLIVAALAAILAFAPAQAQQIVVTEGGELTRELNLAGG